MRRILWALGAAAALVVTMLAPPADAAPAPAPARAGAAIAVVSLGASFTPSAVVLSKGEPLLVTVDGDVTATVTDPAPGSPLAGGPLGSSSYLYFGVKPGITTLSASVGPNCSPGDACPQWRSAPTLRVTVSR